MNKLIWASSSLYKFRVVCWQALCLCVSLLQWLCPDDSTIVDVVVSISIIFNICWQAIILRKLYYRVQIYASKQRWDGARAARTATRPSLSVRRWQGARHQTSRRDREAFFGRRRSRLCIRTSCALTGGNSSVDRLDMKGWG